MGIIIHNNDDLEGKEKIDQERMQRKTTNKAKIKQICCWIFV